MKLIDKDTIVAEIDRLFDIHSSKYDIDEAGVVLLQLRENVESLEVKEVDLDFMLHEYWGLSAKINIDCLECATMTKEEMTTFAKHFFELGLKAQKGEKV